jgi:nicotinamide-nucleotide amidase
MELQNEITSLAAQLGIILTDKCLTITTAESCTGGGIVYALTDTPGSSYYIDRSFITYSNQSKHELLGVKIKTLDKYGAVSEDTVKEMAIGAAVAANADISVAVSGIAGPGGGSIDKPVGLVWVAIKINHEVHTYEKYFVGNRANIRMQVIEFTLKEILTKIK